MKGDFLHRCVEWFKLHDKMETLSRERYPLIIIVEVIIQSLHFFLSPFQSILHTLTIKVEKHVCVQNLIEVVHIVGDVQWGFSFVLSDEVLKVLEGLKKK